MLYDILSTVKLARYINLFVFLIPIRSPLVGVEGIEPSISSSRTMRDTDSLHPGELG